MPYNKIYSVNWQRLCRWMVPSILRKPVFLAVLYAIAAPVQAVHSAFTGFRKIKLYELSINPQVVYLEKMLNDKYDSGLKRIYIADAVWFAPLYIYQEAELKGIDLFLDSENQPVTLRTESETNVNGFGNDFIVYVPSSVIFNVDEMKSLIDKYKLAGRRYSIQII